MLLVPILLISAVHSITVQNMFKTFHFENTWWDGVKKRSTPVGSLTDCSLFVKSIDVNLPFQFVEGMCVVFDPDQGLEYPFVYLTGSPDTVRLYVSEARLPNGMSTISNWVYV